MRSKKSKKGISDVIVSVLMVLLVIVAIGILATFVINFVTKGTKDMSSKTECITTQLEIVSATKFLWCNKDLDPSCIENPYASIDVKYVNGNKPLTGIMVKKEDGTIIIDSTKTGDGGGLGSVDIEGTKNFHAVGDFANNNIYAIAAYGEGGTGLCITQKSATVIVI